MGKREEFSRRSFEDFTPLLRDLLLDAARA